MSSKPDQPRRDSDAVAPTHIQMAGRFLRRRAIPLATSTAAALGFTGCAHNGETVQAPPPLVMTQQRVAADRVRDFTANIDAALDQVDRERLRAAAEKKAASIPPPPAPTTAPSVVLASATADPSTSPPVPAALATPTPATPKSPTALITAAGTPPTPAAMGAMTAMVSPTPDLASAAAPAAALPVVAMEVKEPSIDEALTVLRKRVAAHPTLNTALAMALLDAGDPKSTELAKSLTDSDQKVLTDLLAALQGMTAATSAAGSPTLAERAAPLVDAAKKWQADADLNLPRLVLATRVDSFGVYTAIQPKFEQGKKHTVIIYCEVANFASKKGDDGWFQTRLTQQETLITDDGLLVWRPNAEEVEDRSMNQRRDFYLVKKLTLPDTLAAGKYALRMSVTDRNTMKIAMLSMDIEIAK